MSKSQRGLFIVIEGGEGSGKTTNIEFVREYFVQHQLNFIQTREPGGTPFAESIRQLTLEPRAEKVSGMAEMLLMFAARAQHLEQKILPALAEGQWVLCDRFTDATYAYQGCGRELGPDNVELLENLVQGSLRPDCVIILDVPSEVGMARAAARGELDRMEQEQQSFYTRVRDAYLARAAKHPDNYAVIDASKPLADVQVQLKRVLDALLEAQA